MSPTDSAPDDLRTRAAALIDPQDNRPAWVWSQDGTQLLWANAAGLAALEVSDLDGQEIVPSAPAARSLQGVARTPVGAAGRGRIEILRVSAGGHQETLVATCRPVMIGETVAVLALGSASRSRGPGPAEADAAPTLPDVADATAIASIPAEEAHEEAVRPLQVSRPSGVSGRDADPAGGEPSEPRPAMPDAPAFAFRPRSRPHRFSFMVAPDGRITGLSSGLGEAIGAATALRDGEVASEALLARLGDLPAAIFHGIDERRRFSEHEVLWPISDSALAAPVRLSAFGEDDGSLRVFGTVHTARAAPREESPIAVQAGSRVEARAGPAAPIPPRVAALQVPPLEREAAEAAGLFSSRAQDEAAPAPTVAMAAPLPGGATLAAAASALVAGFAGGIARSMPERTPPHADSAEPALPRHAMVVALDDRLETGEAQAAGLWSDEPAPSSAHAVASIETPASAPGSAPVPARTIITALDDRLATDEAAAAGLWVPAGDASEGAFPAETVKAMRAVAAGIAAGLAGGVARGVGDAGPAPEAQRDGETPSADIIAAAGSLATQPPAATPGASTSDSDLSRPERLTFQEIARRLGARITGREEAAPEAPGQGAPTGEPSGTLHALPASDGASGGMAPGTGERESGGRVLPFSRTEPNAERMVLDRLPLAIIIHSRDAILYGNRAALDLAGLDSLQALKALGSIEALFAGPIDDGEASMVLLRPDGGRVPVSGRLQSVRWDNQPAALLSLRDMPPGVDAPAPSAVEATASGFAGANAADGALPLVRARIGELEAIIDLASDGVVTLDGTGEIKDLNQAAQALVGYAADDLIGRPFRLLFPEDRRQTALDYLDDIASQGRLSLFNEGRELECLTAQGGLVPVFMTLGRLTDDEPATYCAVLRDLSPFKQAEMDLVAARRAAEEASAHKSDFLARVSHEIRTPLNAVIGFSEVMLEERFGPVGSERYRQYLRDIHTSGEHLMSLLNDLLDLSKIEAGKMDLSFGEVDLNEVVRQCLAIMQPQANQGRIIVRTSLPLSLPKVVADLRSVRQIALNLMSNAIKFTDPGGQIIVSTLYEPSGEVSLRVRDTGRGMNAADVQLAMEPFRQVPTTLNQVITGTGLGLPLTKALVEANRAQFGLESTPGEGTLAMMTFPPQRVLAE